VREYLAIAPMPATAMFDHLYASLPPSLQAQRNQVAGRLPPDPTAAADDDG
jgi:hypothetical protein